MSILDGPAKAALLGLVVAGVAACTTTVPLKITQVGWAGVELYLAGEDSFDLSVVQMRVRGSNGSDVQMQLQGVVAPRSFFIVYPDRGYVGPPVLAVFVGQFTNVTCPGLKLSSGSFDISPLTASYSIVISGTTPRNWAGFNKEVNDRVNLGSPPWPDTSGTFLEDGARPLPVPQPVGTAQRKRDAAGKFIDSDKLSDWQSGFAAYCQ